MPNNVRHFEIGADDLEAAARFYFNVFAWSIVQVEDGSDYWLIETGDEEDPGISGALTIRSDDLNPTINTIEVQSVDHTARKIVEEGGRILAPKVLVTGVGYVQYCQDPEGNTFGIVEFNGSPQPETP